MVDTEKIQAPALSKQCAQVIRSNGLTKKIGVHFLVPQVFLSQNKVISRFLLSINFSNFYFRSQIIVISKYNIKVFTFNYCPKSLFLSENDDNL